MFNAIRKRDGAEVPFDENKITKAVLKAAESVGGHDKMTAMKITMSVLQLADDKFPEGTVPTVEEIQDLVEKALIETGHAKTAKSYILYRAERSRNREMNTQLIKTYEDLTFKSAIDCDVKRENANINGDTAMGTMLKYGSEGAKRFYALRVLDHQQSKAHEDGDIHIHDLDFLTLTTTCCQIDLIKLFQGGFSTGHGYLREPNNIGSYSALACIAIQSNQNDQHGGQSVPNFDYAMAEGVKKTYRQLYTKNIARSIGLYTDSDAKEAEDKTKSYMKELFEKHGQEPSLSDNAGYLSLELPVLEEIFTDKKIAAKAQKFTVDLTEQETERATFQAMEALVHNLNTMNSRAGAQTPFSSLNYGTDTSAEGRMVTRNILLANEQGLGNGETPIFPIHIFKVKEGVNFNENDPNYDLFKLAMRVSAKRLFPNFSFLDAPFNLQYYKEGDYDAEVAYMGCRTRVMGNTYDRKNEIVSGRGNLSFTSINLPRLGIEAKGDVDKFFSDLDDIIDLVIKQLKDRFKIQAQKTVRNFPFLMGQGVWLGSENLTADDCVGEILKHGTLSMGFIGLAETLVALTGKHHGESEESRELGLRIVAHMRQRMDEESKNTGLNFTLLASPAEGLSGRFVRIDRERYGSIKGVTDREYYTNSFHVPVYYPITVMEKIDVEAPYHALTNAGHISYVELDGDPCGNIQAFEKIIRYMKEKGIGYGSINHPVDRDPVCGYTGVIKDVCPGCGRRENDGKPKFERIRRITGYLVGTVDRFNNGKRAEERDRIKHGI
ncbi:MAG: anaerobic ribonucleoside triphosphate reductase [Oscillospiraceae bacterium]|jgi:ribonucleoside-triphosphate reductase|nr:anaerobic ribonucleoside triphosphate reductase [Oscillospiraceae bacterium]